MPCERIDLGHGGVAFICSGRVRPQRCQEPGCYRDMAKLCDHPVPARKSGTCDRRLCSEHARPVGEDLDLCPKHFAPREALAVLRQLAEGPRTVYASSPRWHAIMEQVRVGHVVLTSSGRSHVAKLTEAGREALAKLEGRTRDEAAELRAALGRGEWQRLTDPMTLVALLEGAGDWWRDAACSCARLLARRLLPEPDERTGAVSLAGWSVDDLQLLKRSAYELPPDDARIVSELLRAVPRVPVRVLPPDAPERAALAVLEAWVPRS